MTHPNRDGVTDTAPPMDWQRLYEQERIKKGKIIKENSRLLAEIHELRHQLRLVSRDH